MLKRRPSRKKRRRSALAGSCLILVVILLTLCVHGDGGSFSFTSPAAKPHLESYVDQVPLDSSFEAATEFWRSLSHLILNNDPRCSRSPEVVIPKPLDVHFDPGHDHPRPDVLWLDDADVQRLRTAHANFVDDLFKSSLQLPYKLETRGVVTSASDTLLPVLLTSLRMLRAAGSSLPVEVFLDKSSSLSKPYCDTILPSLNARCVFLSHVFREAPTGIDSDSHQLKMFSILFSSFEEFLLIDSDAWPVSNPDFLFDSPPFSETGMILWPDFWYPSESPYFFEIAKIEKIPELNVRAATESGQVLYSKSKHQRSIMLAAYYNYFGPQYYYSLQSQGAPGQGDKETYLWAATALGEDFYTVRSGVRALGRPDSSGDYVGSAMVQYDPVLDFFKSARLPHTALDESAKAAIVENPQQKTSSTSKYEPKPLFVHANHPKFDPYHIFNDEVRGARGPTRDSNGTSVRCWDARKEDGETVFAFDLEKRFWDVIAHVACEDLMGLAFHSAGPVGANARGAVMVREKAVCKRVKRYQEEVFDRHTRRDFA